jgi:hypothetical protein
MTLPTEASRKHEIDGEIYVRLTTPPSNWRMFLLLAALTLSVGGGVLAPSLN